MQIQCEESEKNAIQSYDATQVIINHQVYQRSLLVTTTQIISNLPIHTLLDVNPSILKPIFPEQLTILIIGHAFQASSLSPEQLAVFSQRKIGVECMTLDAAYRTFNLLLSEKRSVGLLICLNC